MKFNYVRAVALAVLTGWLVTACGGGDSNTGPSHFTIGGSVSGLVGTGLVLQDNGGDNLPVSASGNFTFPTTLGGGAAYAVTVKTQPTGPAQNCTVAAGTGTVSGADVTSVVVTCKTNGYTVGGSVTGLSGTGLVLEDNAGDDLPISASQAFTFSKTVGSGSAYAVTVKTQPTGPVQVCTVTNGTGTIAAANVTNVAVNCTTNTFAVGGTASGVVGTGLTVLMNGANPVAVGANGSFTAANLNTGTQYAVTVGTQPTAPSQTCVVANGTGTVALAAVTNITVTCTTNNYAVGGTVTGLAGTGLQLQNGATAFPITVSGSQTYVSLPSGTAYNITVKTQPTTPSQTCAVTNGIGNVTNAAVTNVNVNCITNTYAIGGSISGLNSGGSVVLQDNGGDNLPVTANGTFQFATKLQHAVTYAVTVQTEPSGPPQYCAVINGSGTVNATPVTNIAISCRNTGVFVFAADSAVGAVSSFTIAAGGASSGNLSYVNTASTSSMTSFPVGVAVVKLPSNAGTFLYAADQNSADLSTFSVAADGTLAYVGTTPVTSAPANASITPTPPTPTPTGITVDPTGNYVLVSDAEAPNGTGQVAVYQITQSGGAAGTLTQVAGSPFLTDSNAITGNNTSSVAMTVNPADTPYVLATNQFNPTDGLSGFLFNNPPNSGNLTPLAAPTSATGNDPLWVTVHPSDLYVYVSNQGDGTISGYTFAGGVLTPMTATTTASPFPVGSGSSPGAIAIDYTGRFLYVADTANGKVVAFAINADGSLPAAPIGRYVTDVNQPSGPFAVSVDASGHFVYVGNSYTGTIAMFTADPATGALTPVNGSPLSYADAGCAPTCVTDALGTNGLAVE